MDMLVHFLRFLGWRTHDELDLEMQQGFRRSVKHGDMKRATLLERCMLPRSTRFPVAGDIYEALHDVTVSYLTHWRAPFTGGGEAILPKGEHIVVEEMSGGKPIRVFCQPHRKVDMEAVLIPIEERTGEKYDSYSLSVKTESLNADFRLIKTEPDSREDG